MGFVFTPVSSLLLYTISYRKCRTEKGKKKKNTKHTKHFCQTSCQPVVNDSLFTDNKKSCRECYTILFQWRILDEHFFFSVCFFKRKSLSGLEKLGDPAPLVNAQTHAPNIPVNVDMLPRCELINVVRFICMCFHLYIWWDFYFEVTLLWTLFLKEMHLTRASTLRQVPFNHPPIDPLLLLLPIHSFPFRSLHPCCSAGCAAERTEIRVEWSFLSRERHSV